MNYYNIIDYLNSEILEVLMGTLCDSHMYDEQLIIVDSGDNSRKCERSLSGEYLYYNFQYKRELRA